MKSRGSYLLHWKLLETLKEQGISVYDLNGINPARNPGTYKFKRELAGSNGREVLFVGRFEAHPGKLGEFCVKSAESMKTIYRNAREFWVRGWPTRAPHGRKPSDGSIAVSLRSREGEA
jgi:lipid II:glycine glycyltransferase (peptidoglycan interpeptide bridge formation enzyme)